jgi:hypothetical protein
MGIEAKELGGKNKFVGAAVLARAICLPKIGHVGD